jgi:ATP-dependent Lon protease
MDTNLIKLREKINAVYLPLELREKVVLMLDRLDFSLRGGGISSYSFYEQVSAYIEWVVSLPWQKRSQDILDIAHAREVFEKNHYGLEKIKQRILEFLSVIILQKEKEHKQIEKSNQNIAGGVTLLKNSEQRSSKLSAPILCFVGLVGTGKTTMAVSIAEALNRQLIRIPFGGLSNALDLRGLSRVHSEAEPGIVIKSLRRVNVKNPVILLDELDRVADEKRQEIMGVLVELLDPAQNKSFLDHYLDYPFDLSEAIFVATANNLNKVATAVLDRMEIIQMPSYTDDEKLHIAKDYLLPSAVHEAGLNPDQLIIDEKAWPILIRPLGFDAGIRTLKRIVQGMARKVAWKILNGQGTKFLVNEQNFREFLE